MSFNLTAHLAEKQILTGQTAIRIAARLIAACPCETKRWRAMHELRKLQALARGAA